MRYLLGFLITLGLVVLVVILVLKGSSRNATSTFVKPLSSYSTTDAVASLTIGGPIVADQNYSAVQIKVSQYIAQVSVIRGYQGNVVNTQAFTNNQAAFKALLSALDHFGFTAVNTSYKYTSPAGFCSFGDTYTYNFSNGSSTIANSWASSCGGEGNFKGTVSSINQLLISQIPDYNVITLNVHL